jgi:glycosyltransferase involved in cell wall biosynthesis
MGYACLWFDISKANRKKEIKKLYLEFKGQYPIYIVANPSHILVPLVCLVMRKRPYFDAGWPLYDGVILSRKNYGRFGENYLKTFLIDFFAFKLSKKVFVESQEQKNRCVRKFGMSKKRLVVLETGFDENRFEEKFKQPQKTNKQAEILFRGGDLAEAGIDTLIEAIKLSNSLSCKFIIISNSDRLKDIELPKTDIITTYLSESEIYTFYQNCTIALGQLSSHKRSGWTIPHKFFEAAYMGIPYLSSDSKIMSEYENKKCVCTFKKGNSENLVEVLNEILNNSVVLNNLSSNIRKVYIEKFSQEVLTKTLINHIYLV